ncbi:AlpA family transcriptional regulator [Streptomyces sp. A012304]|uniref:helix-turn-helix transcriptional regulator n=1 Tax=Streptomyces sp. A012304 TaxID=375446 RepID=UPI0022312F4A|nr:helix-turn-helix domain-containing protein [Streptomyces sp. A012304]
MITISEIAAEYGVSRTTVHSYRRSGTFPQPAPVEGTEKTKLRFRADEVAAWFEANPKQQGKRTDLPPRPQQQGATPMTHEEYEDRRRRLEADAADARKALNQARAVYDGICEELRDLRVQWQEQQKTAE